MSTTIFQNGNGMATGFFNVSPGGILSVISIGDFAEKNIGASSYRAIVTDHPIEEAANANVMYAADGHIYMHVPGDKVGAMTVSGLAFSGFCQGEFQGESNSYNFNDQMTGFERVLRWYRANRVSNPKKNDPIEITLGGGLVLKGYLASFATVTIATGKRLQDGKASPIHGSAGADLRNPKKWPWARIYFRNLQTDETTVIFEGFAESVGQSYSFSSTEVHLTIRHWLYALDAHPCINSITHPSSASVYSQMLYYKSLPGSTGTGGTADQKTGLVFRQMMDAVYMAGMDGFAEDVIKNGVMETLKALNRFSEYYTPWDISGMIDEERILKPDIPLSVETILANRIKTGDTSAAQVDKDKFPILKVQSQNDSNSLVERMFESLMNSDVESYQLNSLWAAIVQLAAKFSFMIVPRVHEIRFVPKWFMPQIKTIKILKGLVSSNSSWEYARPVGAAIVLPSSIDGKGISAIDAPGMQSIENDSAMATYGIFAPKDGSPGTLLVRQRADWAGEVSFPGLVRNPQNMDQKEADEGTATTDDGKAPAQKEADSRGFYNALAEEAYWDEMLKGRRADLVCPIRFDVCPGSTVCVKTGGDDGIEFRYRAVSRRSWRGKRGRREGL